MTRLAPVRSRRDGALATTWGWTGDEVLHNAPPAVDNRRSSTESHRRDFQPGDGRASRVRIDSAPTLAESGVIPNPQHLVLTLIFETSLHE